tara:strand:+ start:5252 stop:6595 length:1344 start_codon:yes stop_codon:yes gene_type:complete
MATNNKISTLVEQQFPDFIREEGPKFVAFLEAYYEWMEQTGNAVDVSQNILSYRDIDSTLDEYIQFFEDDFLINIPRNHLTNTPNMLKNIISFYRSRGSEKSYNFLFHILYDDNVEFYYPGEDILRASDGNWVLWEILTVIEFPGSDVLFELENIEIEGNDSGATAIVEQVRKTIVSGASNYSLYISHVVGTFQAGEIVTALNGTTFVIVGQSQSAGHYVGTDGFLSSNKFLQDNFYYQEYSYVLKTNQYIARYRDILKRTVHPSGTKMFGEVNVVDELDFSISGSGESIVDFELNKEYITEVNDLGYGSNNSIEEFTVQISYPYANTAIAGVVEDYMFYPMGGILNAGGTVAPGSNTTIGTYQANTIAELATTVIDELDATNVMIGTGTSFNTDLELDDFIMIRDIAQVNPDQGFRVTLIYSNTGLGLSTNYIGTLPSGGRVWRRE